jgi:hypothetical protein
MKLHLSERIQRNLNFYFSDSVQRMLRRTRRFVRSVKSSVRRRAVPEESQSRNKLGKLYYLLSYIFSILIFRRKCLETVEIRKLENHVRKVSMLVIYLIVLGLDCDCFGFRFYFFIHK